MSLVRPIASNVSFRTIVRTTVDLAHQLGVTVVAEGVESEAVRSELQALGCDLGQGFLLLSVAIWLYLLGDAIQLVYEVVLHQRPDPTWADAAYLGFYPVACAGLFAFPSRRRTRPERLRSLLDVGTVFVAGATLLWYVALGPAVASKPGFDLPDLVIFAYPIGDLLLLFGVLSLLWRGVPQASVTPLRIFATGMLVFIAADVTYDYATIHAPYRGGDPVDTLWMLALTIVWVAAACQPSLSPGPGAAAGPATAVPPAWAERQVPNGRIGGPDAR
jgi:hypothetical protein